MKQYVCRMIKSTLSNGRPRSPEPNWSQFVHWTSTRIRILIEWVESSAQLVSYSWGSFMKLFTVLWLWFDLMCPWESYVGLIAMQSCAYCRCYEFQSINQSKRTFLNAHFQNESNAITTTTFKHLLSLNIASIAAVWCSWCYMRVWWEDVREVSQVG